MIIAMNAELWYFGITVVVTILATTLASIYTIKSTAKETQKIIQEGQENTQKILREIGCVIAKIRTDSKAGAWRDGYAIAENVSEEEAKQLGEPYFYDSATRVCHYKPRKSATA